MEEDTQGECAKFGGVEACVVDPVNVEGRVYVRFADAAAAQRAASALEGRWFARRRVQTEFLAEWPAQFGAR